MYTSGGVEVVVFPRIAGYSGEYCRKYTVGHGVGHGSRPGYHPWSRGDCAGVLPPQQAAWSSL